MDVLSAGLLGQLKGKMHWHNSRQTVLAQNVANVDTPGYKGGDLTPFDVQMNTSSVAMRAVSTHSNHMALSGRFEAASRMQDTQGYEQTPYKNQVTAEQEMLKVTQNQIDYQLATTLYQRNLGLLRLAVRR